jgi:hypothetical protein
MGTRRRVRTVAETLRRPSHSKTFVVGADEHGGIDAIALAKALVVAGGRITLTHVADATRILPERSRVWVA